MQVVSAVGTDAIKGLQVWTARSLKDRLRDTHLTIRRLGRWHQLLCEENLDDDAPETPTAKIPLLPSSEVLVSMRSDARLNDVQLGAVCWRGLLSKYANEKDVINLVKEKRMYREYEEVGAYKDHIAACINVRDLYGYIFKNLNPRSWAKVTLNKQERVTTNIGEFSMIYYSNMKWFHFVPVSAYVTADEYAEQFHMLLEKGHTIKGIDESVLMKATYKTGVSKPWQFVLPSGPRVPDVVTDELQLFSQLKQGILAGGAVLMEEEERIVSYYANFCWLVVWQAASRSIPGEYQDRVIKLSDAYKLAGFDERAMGQVHMIERATWAATKLEDLVPATHAAIEVLVYVGGLCIHAERSIGEKVPVITFCTTAAKIIGGLVDRLHVLGWTKEEWRSLDQYAWLAGIEDGAGEQ